jgi:hypothetical protein
MFKVAAVDPGVVNGAVWIGEINGDGKVRTICIKRGNDNIDDNIVPSRKLNMMQQSAQLMLWFKERCIENNVERIIIETAPFWNSLARISGAVAYGVLSDLKGVNISFSGPKTKKASIDMLCARYNLKGLLNNHTPTVEGGNNTQQKTKADLERIRRNYKIIAIKVVDLLLEESDDKIGLEYFRSEKKKDDVSDAILLALGKWIDENKDNSITKKKRNRQNGYDGNGQHGNSGSKKRKRSCEEQHDEIGLKKPS